MGVNERVERGTEQHGKRERDDFTRVFRHIHKPDTQINKAAVNRTLQQLHLQPSQKHGPTIMFIHTELVFMLR